MSPKHPLVGQPAPVVSLPNADGTTYELKPGAQGKPTAVFFYPQAGAFPCQRVDTPCLVIWGIMPDTYGCTREVCSFRDALTGPSFLGIDVP